MGTDMKEDIDEEMRRRRKALRTIKKLSVKGRADMDYRKELEEALREKYGIED